MKMVKMELQEFINAVYLEEPNIVQYGTWLEGDYAYIQDTDGWTVWYAGTGGSGKTIEEAWTSWEKNRA